MKNLHQYDNMEEMEACKKEAKIEVEKLYNRLGFVVLQIAEDLRLKGKTPIQRRQYFQSKCRGGYS